jgi:hypothetical protein
MTWDDMLLALGERNGNGVSDNGIEELQTMFADCGYIFRHFEDCACGALHWQAGRNHSRCCHFPGRQRPADRALRVTRLVWHARRFESTSSLRAELMVKSP